METNSPHTNDVEKVARRELVLMQARFFMQLGVEMALGADIETAQERAKSTVAIPVPTNATDLHKNWKEKKPRRAASREIEQPARAGI